MQQARRLGLPLLVLFCCSCAAVPSCKPQGLLMLDEPYPPPYRVSLPFCDKYQCSCCNVSHALTIQRSVRSVLLEDELSKPCKAALVLLACKLCDPEVGVGNVSTVCLSTCDDVLQACSQDYFAYDESTGLITPCTSQLTGMLVCSQLSQIATTGADFCKAAGHHPSPSGSLPGSCFDGSPVGPQHCAPAPAAAKSTSSSSSSGSSSGSSSSKSRRSKSATSSSAAGIWPFTRLKRRHKKALANAAQLVLGATASAAIASGVVWLLQRVMQPELSHVARDTLARAAEARARQGSTAAAASAQPVGQAQRQRRR